MKMDHSRKEGQADIFFWLLANVLASALASWTNTTADSLDGRFFGIKGQTGLENLWTFEFVYLKMKIFSFFY